KLRRSALGPGPSVAPVSLRLGAGTPLPEASRSRFERRLGADLSALRLHHGPEAAAAARSVQARAFAVGSHIALGERAPPLSTPEGEELLAHEVAHTLQDGAAGTIRRRTDFDIIGLNPNAAADPGTIYFDYDSATIDPSEQPKIPPLAVPPNQPLTLFGYASEEGDPAGNVALVNRRIRTVGNALRGAGHTAAHTRTPELAASEGQMRYRERRAVSVVPTPVAGPAVPPLGGGGVACNPVEPCGAAFNSAFPIALVRLTTAIALTAANTPDAQAHSATLFPGVPLADVLTGLTGLLGELARMPANHVCHNGCDGQCDRPAYADPGARVMTLCPDFLGSADAAGNAITLLHEGLHMVPGLTTEDIAYRSSRMIDFIGGAQARDNTDSYVVLILRLSGAAAGGPPVDPVGGLPAADQPAARRSLAFLEQWLLQADWDTAQLYEAIKDNKGRAGGWDPAAAYHAGTQHAIAATFGLTDPGAAAPFLATPTDQDQWAVAGIRDRYNRMMFAVWQTPVTVTQTAGPENWAASLGNAVEVTPAFFALAAPDQVLRLLELLAGSLPAADVPVARRRSYAEGAQHIWTHSGRAGP
ncbi:eCIS core domain-containing protein, partial [Falsiroseomonas oryzae]|uniref:eCIS core domain-containing protein n=1 Tax=Falsiroseomonas oryzae TaxID=2766473 RepID=UPI0022EA7E24